MLLMQNLFASVAIIIQCASHSVTSMLLYIITSRSDDAACYRSPAAEGATLVPIQYTVHVSYMGIVINFFQSDSLPVNAFQIGLSPRRQRPVEYQTFDVWIHQRRWQTISHPRWQYKSKPSPAAATI